MSDFKFLTFKSNDKDGTERPVLVDLDCIMYAYLDGEETKVKVVKDGHFDWLWVKETPQEILDKRSWKRVR